MFTKKRKTKITRDGALYAPEDTRTPDVAYRTSLLGMMVGGPSAIEFEEKRGQGDLARSDTLPTEGLRRSKWNRESDYAAGLKRAGVEVLAQVDGDPLFTYARLPPGWKKVATDHALWSKLVDDRGRERATIMYKAAFYDRAASMSWVCALGVRNRDTEYLKEGEERVPPPEGCAPGDRYEWADVYDRRTGRVLQQFPPLAQVDNRIADTDRVRWLTWHKAHEATGASADKWLDEHFPHHADPFAYWDEE